MMSRIRRVAVAWRQDEEGECALRVRLSRLAREIIIEAPDHEDRPKESEYLLRRLERRQCRGLPKGAEDWIPPSSLLGERSKGAEAKAMPHWVVHDFRTAFNTHGCEILNTPPFGGPDTQPRGDSDAVEDHAGVQQVRVF